MKKNERQYQKLRKLAIKYNIPVFVFDKMPGGMVKLAKVLGTTVGVIAMIHGSRIFKEAGVDVDSILEKLYR